jgi:hypothetical protein
MWANNAVSALAAAVDILDTQIIVDDGSIFPSPANSTQIFTIVLRDPVNNKFEIMNVTARSGNVLTVERKAEETEAYDWPVGQVVRHALTAAFFDRFIDRSRRVLHIETQSFEAVGTSTSYTVNPNLINARPGDLLLAFFTFAKAANLAVNRAVSNTVWNKLSIGEGNSTGDDIVEEAGGSAVVAAYRFVEVSDSNEPLQITFGSSSWGAIGVVQIYRNVNQDRPFSQCGMRINPFNNPRLSVNVRGPDMLPQSNKALTAAFVVGEIAEIGIDYDSLAGLEPPIPAIESTILAVTAPLLPNAELAAYTLDYSGRYSDNLFPFSAPNMGDGWTALNAGISVSTDVGDQNRLANEIVFSANTGRHEAYIDIELPPGRYTFSAVMRDSTAPDDIEYYFISVEGPNGEMGFITPPGQSGGVRSTFGLAHYFFHELNGDGSSDDDVTLAIVFDVVTVATYRFRIGGTTDPYNVVSTFGVNSRRILVNNTQLSSMPCAPEMFRGYQTDGYALLTPNGRSNALFMGALARDAYLVFEYELNPRFGEPPPVLLTDSSQDQRADLTADRKGIIGTGVAALNSVAYASAFVDAGIKNLGVSEQRFYFEVVFTTFESTNGESGIGFVPGLNHETSEISGFSSFGSNYRKGFYLYRNDGRIYEGAVWIGTGPSYGLGDVIGAEIDFASKVVRFYKNGILIGDMYGVDLLTEHADVPFRAVIHAADSQNTDRRCTVRFAKNELQYLPVGALPYDYRPE